MFQVQYHYINQTPVVFFLGTFKTPRDFAGKTSCHESRASIEHGLITPGWREAHVLITHPQIRNKIAGLVSLNQPLRYGKWLGNPIKMVDFPAGYVLLVYRSV